MYINKKIILLYRKNVTITRKEQSIYEALYSAYLFGIFGNIFRAKYMCSNCYFRQTTAANEKAQCHIE
jgi:hypothetical protein